MIHYATTLWAPRKHRYINSIYATSFQSIVAQFGKSTAIRCTAVRETGVPRHHGGSFFFNLDWHISLNFVGKETVIMFSFHNITFFSNKIWENSYFFMTSSTEFQDNYFWFFSFSKWTWFNNSYLLARCLLLNIWIKMFFKIALSDHVCHWDIHLKLTSYRYSFLYDFCVFITISYTFIDVTYILL